MRKSKLIGLICLGVLSAVFVALLVGFFALKAISQDKIYEAELKILDTHTIEKKLESSADNGAGNGVGGVADSSARVESITQYKAKILFSSPFFRAQPKLSNIEIVAFICGDSINSTGLADSINSADSRDSANAMIDSMKISADSMADSASFVATSQCANITNIVLPHELDSANKMNFEIAKPAKPATQTQPAQTQTQQPAQTQQSIQSAQMQSTQPAQIPHKIAYKVHFLPSFIALIFGYYLGIIALYILIFTRFGENLTQKTAQKLQSIYNKCASNKIARITAICAIFALTALSFYNNALGIVDKNHFALWQKDTESSVVGKIIADIHRLDTQGYGMVFPTSNYPNADSAKAIYDMLESGEKPKDFSIYRSAIGLQGYAASFIYRNFGLDSVAPLWLIAAGLSALLLVILSVLLARIFGNLFGAVFFMSAFLSPWVVNYGNNLYHLFFIWLLPAVFAYLLFLHIRARFYSNATNITNAQKAQNPPHTPPENPPRVSQNALSRIYIASLLIAFCFSFFIRALCSYEYITSITLFAIAPFFIAPFMPNNAIPLKILARYIIVLFAVAIVGFLIAFIIHTNMRGGGDLWLGLKDIYEKDFLRRMLGGEAKDFHSVYADSLNASIFAVIKKYLLLDTNIIVGLPSSIILLPLLLLDIVLMIKCLNRAQRRFCVALLVAFALPAISWYVLGKAHSFIHTHMNYILWYFGFVASLFYIPLVALWNLIQQRILRSANEQNSLRD